MIPRPSAPAPQPTGNAAALQPADHKTATFDLHFAGERVSGRAATSHGNAGQTAKFLAHKAGTNRPPVRIGYQPWETPFGVFASEGAKHRLQGPTKAPGIGPSRFMYAKSPIPMLQHTQLRPYRASANTAVAPFQPISIAGAFVLPAMIDGNALASITRKPPTPCTRRPASTTEIVASAPIRQVQLG